MYADHTIATPGRRVASLISPLIARPGGVKTQLQFSYRIFGPGTDDLEIALESNGRVKNIFRGAIRNYEWQQGSVEICEEQDFRVNMN